MNAFGRHPKPLFDSMLTRMAAARSLLLASCTALPLAAQAPPAQTPTPQAPETAATLAKMTALRDTFIARAHALGFTCLLAAPKIRVEDVPSLGQYDEETNVLRTSDWTLLNPQERAFIDHLAAPGADEKSKREIFEEAAHGWIFVHELGHWVQNCRGVTGANRPPYGVEYGADRISLAYWREANPHVVDTMMPIFQQVLDHAPNPVPAGQKVEAYFNKNYETLGPSPAYPWFQSRMNVAAYQEKPAPTLAQILASVK